MFRSALVFFAISVVAGILAFTGIIAGITALAQFVFFVALALFAIFLVVALALGKSVL
jgi:uncharacterized membrane protein YtjA (UPF0391 family)